MFGALKLSLMSIKVWNGDQIEVGSFPPSSTLTTYRHSSSCQCFQSLHCGCWRICHNSEHSGMLRVLFQQRVDPWHLVVVWFQCWAHFVLEYGKIEPPGVDKEEDKVFVVEIGVEGWWAPDFGITRGSRSWKRLNVKIGVFSRCFHSPSTPDGLMANPNLCVGTSLHEDMFLSSILVNKNPLANIQMVQVCINVKNKTHTAKPTSRIVDKTDRENSENGAVWVDSFHCSTCITCF